MQRQSTFLTTTFLYSLSTPPRMWPYRTPFGTGVSAQAAPAFLCTAMSMLLLESASPGPFVLPRPSLSTFNSGFTPMRTYSRVCHSLAMSFYEDKVIHALVHDRARAFRVSPRICRLFDTQQNVRVARCVQSAHGLAHYTRRGQKQYVN